MAALGADVSKIEWSCIIDLSNLIFFLNLAAAGSYAHQHQWLSVADQIFFSVQAGHGASYGSTARRW